MEQIGVQAQPSPVPRQNSGMVGEAISPSAPSALPAWQKKPKAPFESKGLQEAATRLTRLSECSGRAATAGAMDGSSRPALLWPPNIGLTGGLAL